MDTLSSFIDMGGYASFVWPAFGVTVVVLVGLLVISLRSLRAREAELALLRGGGAAATSTETVHEA